MKPSVPQVRMPSGLVAEVGAGRTWSDGLAAVAASRPDAVAFHYLRARDDEGDRLTYGTLFVRVASIAADLRRAGLAGERVLVLHAPGPGFIEAFLGCLAGGVVAVPLYPPGPIRPDAALERLLGVVDDCRPMAALVGATEREKLGPLVARHPSLQRLAWVDTESIATDAAAQWHPPPADAADLAFLQYTSGSTSAPKGVMVSHRNISCNARRIGEALRMGPHSRGLSWLPPYHDMGLIGHVLQPLSFGIESVMMSPLSFLQRPLRWLEGISRHRATISFAPNFAYDLVLRKVRPAHLERLDLSCWATAGNGAEPVRAETIERFCETFAPCGFRPEAFCTSYGLAECTLLVSSRHGLVTQTVDRAALEEDVVIPASPSSLESRRIVSVGSAGRGLDVEIVAPDSGVRMPAGRVGEVWVRGGSVAAGYWGRPSATEAIFGARLAEPDEGPFLRTGDLGCTLDGELFIAGRLKDLIVVDGRNHHPQDVEQTVEQHPAVRPGGVIAFSVDAGGRERLVVVAEIARGAAAAAARDDAGVDATTRTDAGLAGAASAIRAAVAERHGLTVSDLLWVGWGSLPRTGSGKPQRRACRTLFLRQAIAGLVART